MPHPSRKPHRAAGLFLVMAAAPLLAGCGTNTLWGDYYQILKQGYNAGFGDDSITRDQASAIPYASLGYRLNDGRETMLVLATSNGADLLWTAASHVVLLTRDGRVVRSVGLSQDRAAMTPRNAPAIPPVADALRARYSSFRTVDLPNTGEYGVQLTCITTARGRQRITILGTSLDTIKVDETCTSNRRRWSFTDSYWLDPASGFVWHSLQHLTPGTTIQIEILRPPE